MLNPAPKNAGGGSQNHLESNLQVPNTVTREEAYKGGQKLQTYNLNLRLRAPPPKQDTQVLKT